MMDLDRRRRDTGTLIAVMGLLGGIVAWGWACSSGAGHSLCGMRYRSLCADAGSTEASPGSHSLPAAKLSSIAALGRIEPRDGVIRIAGPARPAAVIAELLVEQGDRVERNQILAVLDDKEELTAMVERLRAEKQDADNQRQRYHQLHRDGIVSLAEREAVDTRFAIAAAELRRAQAQLDLSVVRSPLSGTVLAVYARRGERVGPQGIVLLADTSRMEVVAEVYETDVPALAQGAQVTVTSPVLAAPLYGRVDRIGQMIGKPQVFDTDPGASVDRRIVEVRIVLDTAEAVAALTNLQVEVVIALSDAA